MSSNNPYDEIPELRRLVQKNPDSAESHFELGVALLQAKDHKSALESFKQAIQLNEKDSRFFYNLALCYQHLNLYDSAINAYKDAVLLSPADYEAWSNLGLIMYRRGELEQSVEFFTHAVEQNPNSAELWKNLGFAQFGTEQIQVSIDSFRSALAIVPEDAAAWAQLGLNYYALGQYQNSAEHFEKSLAIHNDSPETWNNLGNCLVKQNRVEEAETAYGKAIALLPSHTDAWFNLAELHYQHGRKGEATDCLERVVKAHPEDREAWRLLGLSTREENLDRAVHCFERLLELGEEKLENLATLADLYRESASSDELPIRTKVFRVDPYHVANNKRLALLRLDIGKPDAALEVLQKCSDPKILDISQWKRLSQYFRSQGETDTEIYCLEKMLALDSSFCFTWARLGELAFRSKMVAKSFQYYAKASQEMEDRPDIWFSLANALRHQFEFILARQCLAHCIGLIPFSSKDWKKVFRRYAKSDQLEDLVIWLENELVNGDYSLDVCLRFNDLFLHFGFAEISEWFLSKLKDQFPEAVEVQIQIGILLIEMQRLEKAIQHLKETDRRFPDNPYLQITLADAYRAQGDLQSSENCLATARSLHPNDHRLWQRLALLAYGKDEYQTAIEHYLQSIAICRNSRSFCGIAQVYRRLEETQKAESHWRNAISMDRWHADAWLALAEMAEEENRLINAKWCCLKSLASRRNNPDAGKMIPRIRKALQDRGDTAAKRKSNGDDAG